MLGADGLVMSELIRNADPPALVQAFFAHATTPMGRSGHRHARTVIGDSLAAPTMAVNCCAA
ncbi:hypothetical protein CGZ92_10500 [Parenemella sanctibonifatiensis]|uniref:Uncharacterized protein n=2 Tax=Parenemella sanctibonifatiensis TaxID=2016505 RepID=A0A255E116_9ACTN|nr:hypothetical protein CGZ92_10500 [Parenemella sanctibonifatiensis]